MSVSNYVLSDDGEPVPCPDVIAWGTWFEGADRNVAHAQISAHCRVSTVFLGIDHNFARTGAPILWETMIFGGRRAGYQRRYISREDALEGHAQCIRLAKGDPTRRTGRQRTRGRWRQQGRR